HRVAAPLRAMKRRDDERSNYSTLEGSLASGDPPTIGAHNIPLRPATSITEPGAPDSPPCRPDSGPLKAPLPRHITPSRRIAIAFTWWLTECPAECMLPPDCCASL